MNTVRRIGASGRCLGAALLAVLVGTSPQAVAQANDDRGWAEVTSSRPTAQSMTPRHAGGQGGRVNARPGDRLWLSRDGDTFSSIARRTAGSPEHARAIAHYNERPLDAVLAPDTVLYVPASLLSGGAGKPSPIAWEIREFDTPPVAAPIVAERVPRVVTERAAVRPIERVRSERLDLFAGEVSVLGKVSVTRVAIGNGDIVRAEVLDGGELLVIAQAEGSTSLRLWHDDGRQSDYNIRVSASDPETRVRMDRMVRMRVRMVEFRKSALGRLGIDWADSTAGPGFAAAGDAIGNNLFRPASEGFGNLPNTVQPFSTYFGIASNITSRINFLASNGDATTLAEPVLTASNGGTASFLAGGEVPYPSVGANGQTVVQFKEYGIKLDVAPRIDSAGNVRTVVQTEISQLDPAVSIQGAPGLLTRRAQTEVNVRSGETIVISGLLSSESSSDVDRVPGIGRLPIIGAFFRSTNRRDTVTELVIFVTPEVIDPADELLQAREQRRFEDSTHALRSARQTFPLLD